jgi:hypothetical protein
LSGRGSFEFVAQGEQFGFRYVTATQFSQFVLTVAFGLEREVMPASRCFSGRVNHTLSIIET